MDPVPIPTLPSARAERWQIRNRNARKLARTSTTSVKIAEADIVVKTALEDIARAGKDSIRGWPENSSLFPMGRPTDVIRNPVFIAGNFRSLEAFEPLAAAQKAAGACCVEPRDSRT